MTFHPTNATEFLEFPAARSQRLESGAGAPPPVPAPAPHPIPAGAATTHETARRGLGDMGHHFEAMHAETKAQRAMQVLCWIAAAMLIGAIGLFAWFVAAKAGASIALAFIQAGY